MYHPCRKNDAVERRYYWCLQFQFEFPTCANLEMFAKVLDSSLCSCAILHGAHANANAFIHGGILVRLLWRQFRNQAKKRTNIWLGRCKLKITVHTVPRLKRAPSEHKQDMWDNWTDLIKKYTQTLYWHLAVLQIVCWSLSVQIHHN